jgi:hypothetical protein
MENDPEYRLAPMAGLMRLATIALFLALPASLKASDCAREGQSLSHAYKAYNDCSAAGRGAAGCAGETSAYETARAQFDACFEQRRVRSSPSWEAYAGRDTDDPSSGRGDREPEPQRSYPEPFRAPRR